MLKYKRVLCIPDLQAPYHHKNAIRFLKDVKAEVNPDLVVCLGDELDQYTLSRFAHNPDAPSGGDEYRKAMQFMRELYGVFPEVRAVTSNHVERVSKRAAASGIPSNYLRPLREFMRAPEGWEWRDHWIIDRIRYEHGDRASSGAAGLRTLVVANMQSTVIGHQHESPGTTWVSNGDRVLWGLNAGCLVDGNSYGLSYTKKNRHKPVHGCGIIIDGVPRFIPM